MIIELEREDVTLTLDVTYHPGSPGVRTLPNGDPGYPDDPDDIDIVSITPDVELTDAEISEALELAAANFNDRAEYELERYYDMLNDDRHWKS